MKSQDFIQEVDRGNLTSASMTGTQASLSTAITDEEINNLSLQLLQEGNEADKQVRLATLKQSLIALILDVKTKAGVFDKSGLSGMVTDTGDIDKLWGYLKKQKLIEVDRGHLKSASMTGTQASLSTAITDEEINNLSLQLLREGNEADQKARRARLKQSLIALLLDVAKVHHLYSTQ